MMKRLIFYTLLTWLCLPMLSQQTLPFTQALTEAHIGQNWEDITSELYNRYSGNRGAKKQVIIYEEQPTLRVEMQAGYAGPGWGESKGYIMSQFPKGDFVNGDGTPVSEVHWNYWIKYDEGFDFAWGGKSGISLIIGNYSVGKKMGMNALAIVPMHHRDDADQTGFNWNTKITPDRQETWFDVYLYSPWQIDNYGDHIHAAKIERGRWYKVDWYWKRNTWTSEGANPDGEIIVALNEKVVWKKLDCAVFTEPMSVRSGMGFFWGGDKDWMAGQNGVQYFRPGGFYPSKPEFMKTDYAPAPTDTLVTGVPMDTAVVSAPPLQVPSVKDITLIKDTIAAYLKSPAGKAILKETILQMISEESLKISIP